MSQQLLRTSDQTRFGFGVTLLAQGNQVAQLIGSIVISIKQAEWFNVMHIYDGLLSFALPFAAYLTRCAVSCIRSLSLLMPTCPTTQIGISATLEHRVTSATLAFAIRQSLAYARAKLSFALASSLHLMNCKRLSALNAIHRDEVLRASSVRVRHTFTHLCTATLGAIAIWIGFWLYEFFPTARANPRFSLAKGIEFGGAFTTTEFLRRLVLVDKYTTAHCAVNHSVHPYALILNGVGRWVDETAPFGDQPSRHTQLYHTSPVRGRFLS